MAESPDEHRVSMRIQDISVGPSTAEGYRPVTLVTSRGEIECRHYPGASSAAMLWLGGAGGGWDSPARDLYQEMAEEFASSGVSSLRIKFRFPAVLAECVLDAIAGTTFLTDNGDDSIGIVGHSFGGAVAIQAAASVEFVRLVVGLATQSAGSEPVRALGPRCAVLLAHGFSDRVIPVDASRLVYAWAQEPKELSLYDFADHSLDLPSSEIRKLIREGVERYVASAAVWPPVMARSASKGAN